MAAHAKHIESQPRVIRRKRHLRLIPGGVTSQSKKKGRRGAVPVGVGKARKPGFPFVVLSFFVVAVFVFGLVVLNILVAQGAFRLRDLQADVAREEARYRAMRYQIASQESPAKVAESASNIGLVAPEQQFYILGPERDVEVAEKDNADKVEGGELKAMLGKR